MKQMRKAQTKLIRFVSQLELNCESNQQALISKAKVSQAFGPVSWEAASWNVNDALNDRKRGHTARQNSTVHFTQHRRDQEKIGQPFEEPFSSVVKALTSLRYLHGGQSLNSQMVFIRACRYIYDALTPHYNITLLTQVELDLAAKTASTKEAETSFYKLVGHIEEMADLIDLNRLSKQRLDYRCKVKKRPSTLSDDRLEDAEAIEARSNKLPPEEAIKAIGQLYSSIPKTFEVTEIDDRLGILACALLTVTGLRIGELLTLPARPVQTDKSGAKYLIYYVQKISKGNVLIKKKRKNLLTQTIDLVQDIVNELLERTEPARILAKLLFEKNSVPEFEEYSLEIPMDQLLQLGFQKKSLILRLKRNKIPYRKIGSDLWIQKKRLLEELSKDYIGTPVIQGNSKVCLELHEALFVVFPNQMALHATTRHATRLLNQQMIADFLKPRAGRATIFERHNFFDEEGKNFQLKSHGFRHFLNNLLDEGGAPDLVQAEWFGRKYLKDNKAYQHMTPVQRAVKFKQDLQDGLIEGTIPKVVRAIPIDHQAAFLEARIKAVHDVGLGLCTHDFSQTPCPKHMQCSANCADLHWHKTDKGRLEELQRRTAIAQQAHETAKQAVAEEHWGADQWLNYNEKILKNQKAQLASMGIVKEMDSNHG